MSEPRPVLVVDFGAQYAQLIARRVRECHVYSELVPHSTPVAAMLAREPAAIILSGGPSSVYEPGAPQVDPALFDAGVPVFGICYGFQAMARALGGAVAKTGGDGALAWFARGGLRAPGAAACRRPVPPRGGAHPARARRAQALPLRPRRHRADLDQ
jgi:hypothetical protein